MSDDALSRLEEHVAALDALVLADDAELPVPPDLSGQRIDPADLDRARALLVELAAAHERLTGLRVHVRGEIEGMRRRRPEPPTPAPRVVDTTA